MFMRKNLLVATSALLSFVALIALLTPSTSYSQTKVQNVNVVGTVPKVPFQEEVILVFGAGNNGTNGGFMVPAGRRLIIEHVSGLAALEIGQRLKWSRISTLAMAGGTQVAHYLATTQQASVAGIADYYVMSQPMLAYAVGAVEIAAFRSDVAGTGQVNVSVSGYLVAVP